METFSVWTLSIKANWRMRVAMLFIGKKYRVGGAWTKNVVEHVK